MCATATATPSSPPPRTADYSSTTSPAAAPRCCRPRTSREHVEHGWATTIDGAQGATTDIAILLARPGIDREHLYVGLTRGREENHAYLAPPVDDDHAHPTAGDTGARALLQAALARSGRNDAAHTLLDRTNAATRAAPDPPQIRPGAWAPMTRSHRPVSAEREHGIGFGI